MTRFPFPALVCLAILFTGGCGAETTAPGEAGLIWQDEFDGPVDQSPDPTKWNFDVGGHGWGNAQLEHNTARPDNVSLDGEGHLRIVARREAYDGNAYTSGRIKTEGKFAQAYGRFEARIKLPIGQGIWPAFWLLGADFADSGWPGCGEIDIMEYRGQAPNVVNGAMHGPGYSGGAALHGSYVKPGPGFDEGFHVFAVEWNRTSITWYVDDQPYMTKEATDLPAGSTWVFNHPFFILLNVAIGGHYVGPPNSTTEFPQTMLVDWVRVYGES